MDKIKIGDLVRFTEQMPGIVTDQENRLTFAPRDKPLLVLKVIEHKLQDSCGYDYVVLLDKSEIICMNGDIELFKG